VKRLVGATIADKVGFGSAVFGILAFIAIVAGLGDAEDLDRPGGQYDALHGRTKK
jgi:hypothetical protein